MPATVAEPELTQAFALFTEGKLQESHTLLCQILDQNPGNFDALSGTGLVKFKLGQFDDAAVLLGRALQVRPEDLTCRLNLVHMMRQHGDLLGAARVIEAGFEFHPGHPELNLLRRDIRRRILLQRWPLAVLARSDFLSGPPAMKMHDGDFWFVQNLRAALAAAGAVVNSGADRALLLLHGFLPPRLPPVERKLIWIHSHPDNLSANQLKAFDAVFSLSPGYAAKMRGQGIPADVLIGGTEKLPPQPAVPLSHGIVFVGNARRLNATPEIRPVLRDVLSLGARWLPLLEVWGLGWDTLVPRACIKGSCIHNRRLAELYAGSVVVLNDHHEDMRREGFLNPRLLDVMAAGGVAVSDDLAGSDTVFGDALLRYRTPAELDQLLMRLFGDDAFRQECATRGRHAVRTYTFARVAEQILDRLLAWDQEPGSPSR